MIKYVIIDRYATVSIECSNCNRIISFGVNKKDLLSYLQGADPMTVMSYVPHYSLIMFKEQICESCRHRSKRSS